ncbi:MAG: MFS transporter [Planctomycetaceae bacterium]
MDHPTSPLVEPATRERLSIRRAGLLSSIFFGASVTEAVSVHLLPLTLALSTRDPVIITLVLAINPAFGFIAQPLVGVLSDHVWTRFGRRAVFVIVSGPIIAASLLWIPFSSSFELLVVTVVVLQFFQDVVNGSDQPLLADLAPPEQRTSTLGLVKSAENVGFLLVLSAGMPLVESYAKAHGEHRYGLPLYAAAAGCQIVFVALAALCLDEQPIPRQPRPRLSAARYVADFLHQPMLPRIAAAYFLRAFARTAVVGSAALYARHTLQMSEQEYGASWGLMPLIALVSGVPLGWLAERYAKQRVLQLAFTMLIAASGIGYCFGSAAGLTAAALVFGIGDMLLEVTHKAFMSEYYPADLIGQLSGAVNCFYAAGRTAALITVGWCVKLTNPTLDWASLPEDAQVNYGVIWLIASAAAAAGITLLTFTRDYRHEARTQRKGPHEWDCPSDRVPRR